VAFLPDAAQICAASFFTAGGCGAGVAVAVLAFCFVVALVIALVTTWITDPGVGPPVHEH